MSRATAGSVGEDLVHVPVGRVVLDATLAVPEDAEGIVLFAHGSGSSRHSPRNRYVAAELQHAGLATLLLDLLTPDEEEIDVRTAHLRFDIQMLADRLAAATDWLDRRGDTKNLDAKNLDVGYFGASTGGGAALVAAAARTDRVGAVVSRGGRPDLAGPALPDVRAPTLLVVGGEDHTVLDMNRSAVERMTTEVKLAIVPGATHLFEEPGALEQVADLARDWFLDHLRGRTTENRGQGKGNRE